MEKFILPVLYAALVGTNLSLGLALYDSKRENAQLTEGWKKSIDMAERATKIAEDNQRQAKEFEDLAKEAQGVALLAIDRVEALKKLVKEDK